VKERGELGIGGVWAAVAFSVDLGSEGGSGAACSTGTPSNSSSSQKSKVVVVVAGGDLGRSEGGGWGVGSVASGVGSESGGDRRDAGSIEASSISSSSSASKPSKWESAYAKTRKIE